jgi:cobalt/nickel transport system permease protein
MHMADALLSPAVGGAMWAASAATLGWSARKVREDVDDRKVPLMGVLGAFIFAAQMVNFTIPATGSSGHLGGGMILAILLGPHAAFLVMASVLTVQALFFADGGLLALGCNIFNLAFFTSFVAYPVLFRKIAGERPTPGRISAACMVSAVTGLQLGSLGVVLETVASGVSSLPFATFATIMQPIHLAIGAVEGFVTAAVVAFIWKAQPGIIEQAAAGRPLGRLPTRSIVAGLAVAALLTGGALSWFASSNPDGLEWAIGKVTGGETIETPGKGIHGTLAEIQERLAFLPDYGFAKQRPASAPEGVKTAEKPARSVVDPGTSVSGIVGGAITLAIAALAGLALRKRSPK